MNLRPDTQSRTVEKIQNNFNHTVNRSNFSSALITNSSSDEDKKASLNNMRVGINYETFSPKNHLE